MKAIEVDDTWREVLGVLVDENRSIVLLRDGTPVALLVPYPTAPALERKGGVEITMPELTGERAPSGGRTYNVHLHPDHPRGRGRRS